MCHHKAPHRPWDPKPEHRALFQDPIPKPDNFHDDYQGRAMAAAEARMRVVRDMTFEDLDLVELPETEAPYSPGMGTRKLVPQPKNLEGFSLRCQLTGEEFTFDSQEELADFKYQRYLRKYLQCVHSIDENTGRLLDYLESNDLLDNTVIIYTSDQGFFLGEHGWFDKRFIYDESFKMPFLVRYPEEIEKGSVCREMVCNVDFAPTFLELAGLPVPNYMQGRSILPLFRGEKPDDWTDLAYHRYWMNQDSIHNAYAHYGIRTHRYKLIYWHNQDCGDAGSNAGTGNPEWELFDLDLDPTEMKNVYHDPSYAEVVDEMTGKLNDEMERIGDVPIH